MCVQIFRLLSFTPRPSKSGVATRACLPDHKARAASAHTGRRNDINHCKLMAAAEEGECFVKPRLSPRLATLSSGSNLVHMERDKSSFWLKEKHDSLDFQVFQHSLKNSVVGQSPALTGCAVTLTERRHEGSQYCFYSSSGERSDPIVRQPHKFLMSSYGQSHLCVNSLHITLIVYRQPVHNRTRPLKQKTNCTRLRARHTAPGLTGCLSRLHF